MKLLDRVLHPWRKANAIIDESIADGERSAAAQTYSELSGAVDKLNVQLPRGHKTIQQVEDEAQAARAERIRLDGERAAQELEAASAKFQLMVDEDKVRWVEQQDQWDDSK